VSIDDHEVHNLRALMNEVFGEENFVATIIWQKVFAPKNTARHFSVDHDFVVVYARNGDDWNPNTLPRSEEADARYTNPDNDPRGPWASDNLTARNYYSKGTYAVVAPGGSQYLPPTGRYWTIDFASFQELDNDKRIWWGQHRNGMPRLKRFLSEVRRGLVPRTFWHFEEVGHTQEAKQELLRLVQFGDTSNVLNSVKPTRLLQRMLQIGTNSDSHDIVLDFFAGSAVTGHAVFKQNAEDGGNRRFICVQLPEPLPAPEPSLATIVDIGKQRLRSAGQALISERDGKLALDGNGALDTGYRSYKLAESNFTPWNGDGGQIASVEQQIELFTENVLPDRSSEDLLTEILLKSGYELTTPVEWLTLAGNRVASVADGALLVCLDRSISLEAVEAMAARDPGQIVCLEAGFEGDDQRKVNALQLIRSRARSEDTTIAFKVV
jgi:adenine-specific DNA-methyltransferase